ncbi:hypothetical protein ABT300_42440 [Streptomyces sp. NPDC001027]|uniref:hypothetical protein n=1 Tax=Streptomyces sp. NPDC001027 TaxID=3154771 RepID=UPI0033235937
MAVHLSIEWICAEPGHRMFGIAARLNDLTQLNSNKRFSTLRQFYARAVERSTVRAAKVPAPGRVLRDAPDS